MDLSGKIFLITGANSGVGKELTQFLASQKATVYMLCRSRTRAEAALAEIKTTTGSESLYILEGDVGLERDVRRCWAEFSDSVLSKMATPRLDGVVCNAGALLNEKTLTAEGV